ncbi:MAG: hypothetical protein RL291_1667 [Pseudomonadota bacterium]
MTALINFCYRLAVIGAVALVLGLGSAWVMISRGSGLTTERIGAWVTWPSAGRADADPYTLAHTVRSGLLPINSSLSATFRATQDNEGQRLVSSCEYAIESEAIDAQWWSLAVFNENGWVIRNSAERHAFNAATAIRESGGGFIVTLARDARPGNWLPTAGGGNLVVEFSVLDGRWAQPGPDQDRLRVLPAIRRVGCR